MSKLEHPYLKLIDNLLSNPQEQEINILNANQLLVNQEFISCLMSVGEKLRRSGNISHAERLINLAGKLLQLEKTNSSANRRQEYFQLLMTLLQKVANQESSSEIHTFIRDNQDKIDHNITKILHYWANKTISSIDSPRKRAIACDLVNFGNLIGGFPAGDKANNLELAIVSYQAALKAYPPSIFPKNWALIQANLGNAFRDRVRGNRRDNIEQAIANYQLALEVITKEKYPYLWANTQRNQGIAYTYRVEGDRAKNIEQAIILYKRSLSIHTLEDYPQDWAATHNNLGDIYPNRLVGDKAANIETAINHLEKALQIYDLSANPHRWAMLQNTLGNAFQSRINGEQSSNIE